MLRFGKTARMAFNASFLVNEGIAALRTLRVQPLPDDDLVVLAVLLLHLVVCVDRAVLLEALD